MTTTTRPGGGEIGEQHHGKTTPPLQDRDKEGSLLPWPASTASAPLPWRLVQLSFTFAKAEPAGTLDEQRSP